MRKMLLGALVAAIGAVPALAQAPQTQTQQAPTSLTAGNSPMAGIAFNDQPFPVADDGTFSTFMRSIAQEVGRSCNGFENYGWGVNPKDQGRANLILNGTMQRLKQAGYAIQQQKPPSIKSEDQVVFSADGKSKNLLVLWSVAPDAVMLQLCDTGAPAKAKPGKK